MELERATVDLVTELAAAAEEMKAINPVAINVGERTAYCDVFLIVSADNERQVRAVTRALVDRAVELGWRRPSVEGAEEAQWVLLDFGVVTVHVQLDTQREYYGLERLWADCSRLPFAQPAKVGA
ncbi:ribosome silencing factor [Gleimia hominis]|uniref:ribosome silencing factor n=1 Tax=Gleimia hominis TaxID=595468 RepID=UPI001E547070|nr:ribosome silencing factor [Gleimia hominis]WIK65196.1 ribosome silencing factor [Gleimia hominis]